MMISTKKLVAVVALGTVPEMACKVIAAHISGYFNLDAQILTPLESPEYAFDDRRFQYDAGVILKRFESIPFPKFEKIIGVLDGDLFVPIFEYTFGEARQGGKFGVVSLCRLGRNPAGIAADSSQLYERAAKVALHELGHLFDLVHCDVPHCLMHFSGGLDDLDEIHLYLCRRCSRFLEMQKRALIPQAQKLINQL